MTECSGESTDTYSLGLVVDGSPGDEHAAIRDVVQPLAAIDVVALRETTPSALQAYDLVWWHPDSLSSVESIPTAALGTLSTYVREGGGLLLGRCGLAAVDRLGIDPVTPDKIERTRVPNHDWAHQQAGVLVHPRFTETVVFDNCEDTRVTTQPAASESAPRLAYERRVPRHGEVLASTFVGGEDRPAENSVLAWEPGDGRVLGVGQYFAFLEATGEFEGEMRRLLGGVFEYLARGSVPAITGRPKTPAEMRAMRTEVSDRHRPQYHFSPPANWLNDPNGLIQYDGTYHLFYQYNPAGPYHGSIHWGHATSEDLLHWEDRSVALTPDPKGPDADGCWSGCAVDADGVPTIVYTGGDDGDQLPCLAEATDDSLDDWQKHPENPVIDTVPEELDILSNDEWNAEFRDHDVWYEDGRWYQLVGSGIEHRGGTAILYTSQNLLDWEYVGPILVGDMHDDGGMWECPELLRFEEYDLLQVSNYDDVVYYSGWFDGAEFERVRDGVADHGNYYAAQTMQAEDGRHLSWGWIREDRDQAAQWAAGWSGAMSLPRELSVDDCGALRVEPAAEVSALREAHHAADADRLAPSDRPFPDASGDCLEIRATVSLADATAFELDVLATPDGEQRTTVRYTDDGAVAVDRRKSSDTEAATTTVQRIDERPGEGPLDLRLFVDRSVLELYVDGRTCLSSRVYPTREDATEVRARAVDGTVDVETLELWHLRSTTESREPIESRPSSGGPRHD